MRKNRRNFIKIGIGGVVATFTAPLAFAQPVVRHTGFFPNPNMIHCICGNKRTFWFNHDGLRTWRCGVCEQEDIKAYLRCDYGEGSSKQFQANMQRFFLRLAHQDIRVLRDEGLAE